MDKKESSKTVHSELSERDPLCLTTVLATIAPSEL